MDASMVGGGAWTKRRSQGCFRSVGPRPTLCVGCEHEDGRRQKVSILGAITTSEGTMGLVRVGIYDCADIGGTMAS